MNAPWLPRFIQKKLRRSSWAIRREVRSQDWFPVEPPSAIFFHIPKTAGRALNTWISNQLSSWWIRSRNVSRVSPPPPSPYYLYLGHNHFDFLTRSGLFTATEVTSAFSFTFVRNPYSRAASLYKHLQRNDNLDVSFLSFLECLEGKDSVVEKSLRKRIRAMGQPMTTWFGTNSLIRPSKVYRYEEIASAIEEIGKVMGLEASPSEVGKSPRDQHNALIGDQEARRIQELYQRDFKAFNYSLEVPQDYVKH